MRFTFKTSHDQDLGLFRDPVQRRWYAALLAAVLGLGGLTGYAPGWDEVYWSPYQKLMVRRSDPANLRPDELGVCHVSVNNASYQEIVDLLHSGSSGGVRP